MKWTIEIETKEDVWCREGPPDELLGMMLIARAVMRPYGPLIVTALEDGTHMRGSKHFAALAFDFRTSHLGTNLPTVMARLRKALPLCDVVDEPTHGHVEWDPK